MDNWLAGVGAGVGVGFLHWLIWYPCIAHFLAKEFATPRGKVGSLLLLGGGALSWAATLGSAYLAIRWGGWSPKAVGAGAVGAITLGLGIVVYIILRRQAPPLEGPNEGEL